MAFKQCVVDSVSGLNIDNVVDLTVIDVGNSASLHKNIINYSYYKNYIMKNSYQKHRKLVDSGVLTNYKIVIETSKSLSGTSIVTQLNTTITSGEFNIYLHDNSIKYDADSMKDCTTSGLSAIILKDPEPYQSNNDLAPGVIVGIVFFILSLFILGTITLCFFKPELFSNIFDSHSNQNNLTKSLLAEDSMRRPQRIPSV